MTSRLHRGLLPLLATVLFLGSASGAEPGAGSDPPPRRIIVHLPNLAEAVFAMGLGDRVVGVTDFVLYPPEAAAKPRVGGVIDPDFERVLMLRPDLALLHSSQTELAARYRAIGVRALLLSDRSIPDVLATFREIGRVCGVPERAAALVARVQADLDAVRARARAQKPVRTLVVVGHEPGSLQNLFVAASGSVHDALLGIAGGVNVMARTSVASARISTEEILRQNPEAILMLYPDASMSAEEKRRRVALWKPLSYLDAVRRGRVTVLSADYMMIPGPRMGRIARDMEAALHAPAAQAPTGY